MSPGPAALLLAAVGTAALLADHIWSVALITVALLAVCLRAPSDRRRVYLFGALFTGLGVLVLSPLLWSSPDGTILWEGPTIPVLGPLDVTTVELAEAVLNALRLTALGLAFAAYALLLDHDRLVAAAGVARRSALAVALATRLVPSLERDAVGLAESVRGEACGSRGREATRRSSPRSCPARSSERRVSPRRWRRAASAAQVRRARRGRLGARGTGSCSRLLRCLSWWRRCGSSVGRRPLILVSGRGAGPARRLADARARRGRGAARPVWLGKVHAPARPLRTRAALPRRARSRVVSSWPASTHGVPALLSSPARSLPSFRIRRTRS